MLMMELSSTMKLIACDSTGR